MRSFQMQFITRRVGGAAIGLAINLVLFTFSSSVSCVGQPVLLLLKSGRFGGELVSKDRTGSQHAYQKSG